VRSITKNNLLLLIIAEYKIFDLIIKKKSKKGKKMKKTLIVISALSLVCMFFAACSSLIENVNATGSWDYTTKTNKGKMELYQQNADVTGTAIDSTGKYEITGRVKDGKLILEGKGGPGNFTASCNFTSNSTLEGTFTSTEGKTGEVRLIRITK
jgi:hypothetical protein